MKKSFGLFALFAILLSSCQTVTKTARTADISSSLQSVAVADLEVADQRITHTMTPGKEIRRGGLDNIKQAVEFEALAKHGNADVLLEPQYVISKKRSLFGSKITSISVSGRPAHYKNFRSLNDSVWSNPVFRGVKVAKRPVYRKRSYAGGDTYSFDQPYRTKGFASYVVPFIGSSTIDSDDAPTSEAGIGVAALMSVGRQFNPNLYIGLGIGVTRDSDRDETFFPFFLNPRWYFSEEQKSLFLDVKIGYGFLEGDFGEGGLFGGCAVGYSFGKVDVALQYIHQKYIKDMWWDEFDFRVDQIGLSVGFNF